MDAHVLINMFVVSRFQLLKIDDAAVDESIDVPLSFGVGLRQLG
jgi:hypothetical protein